MPTPLINRIWFALLCATLTTFWLGESGPPGAVGTATVLIMFALAWGKGLLVILHFMELRHAPALWRRLMTGWLTLVTTVIVLTYAIASWLS